MDEDLPVVDPMTLPLPEESDEERYGVIKAPNSPLMARAAEMFRGVERRVEGSPAEFMLPGGGIAQVLERKAYGEDPSTFEYAMAGLDTLDIVPGAGTAISTATKPLLAIFAGPGSVSGYKKIRELLEKEKAGETPEAIFEETGSFRSPIHGRAQFEIDDTGAKFREDSDIFNVNRPVMEKRESRHVDDIVAKIDIQSGLGRPIEFGETFNVTERFSQSFPRVAGHVSRDKVSLESKGMQYLEEILDHPGLFKEYPAAKRIKVEEVPSNFPNRGNTNGLFDPVTETIYINSRNLRGEPQKILPKLFHEIQHWVQNEEGFPFGDIPKERSDDLVKRMQTLREEFVKLENQTTSFLEPIVESAFKSVGELAETKKGLSNLRASAETVQKQSKKLSQNLRSFYADYMEALESGRQAGTFADFIRENAKPGDFGILDELKGGAGPVDSISDFSKVITKSGRESTLDALGPIFRRMDKLGEEGFELSYQARLQQEKAFQDYSSTAGEYEARIVEQSSREKGRIPPTPAQRLEEERDRMLAQAEQRAIKRGENPYTVDRPENIRFSERFPPTAEIFDEFGNLRVPQQKAQGGGVQSLSPIAKNMFRGYDDVKRGVGSYMPHTRYSRRS